MKTQGICNAQSARKHRKQGHLLMRLADGRYQWFNREGKGGTLHLQMWGRCPKHVPDIVDHTGKAVEFRPYQRELVDGLRAMKGNDPTGVLFDEIHHPVTSNEITGHLSGKEYPEALFTGGAVVTCKETGVSVQHHASYWPKRRNQHSKPYRVVGFKDGTVIFARGDDVVSGTLPLAEFCGLIGKRCAA